MTIILKVFLRNNYFPTQVECIYSVGAVAHKTCKIHGFPSMLMLLLIVSALFVSYLFIVWGILEQQRHESHATKRVDLLSCV